MNDESLDVSIGNDHSDLVQTAVSILSCIAILSIISIFGIFCLVTISLKYKLPRQSAHFGDGWMSVCLVAGAFLSISAIVPFSARVLFILNYDKGDVSRVLSPESELQCGAWLLSLGASFMFGSQAVLAWRRWKIQNAHFFIRLEYWATIILLVILVDMAQLTLWQTTDPFRCKTSRENEIILKCSIHYLPLWLLSNFLHKGVLIFTTIFYSWRMQLQSTSGSIFRSVSGCSLINSSFTCVTISLLAPLICISNDWPALQLLSVSLLILLIFTSGVALHFIPTILNAIDDRNDQIVRLRNSDPQNSSSRLLSTNEITSNGQISSMQHLARARFDQMQKTKALVRLGASRDILCNISTHASHHKSCSFIDQSSVDGFPSHRGDDSRVEQARFSNISSVSTTATSNNLNSRQAKLPPSRRYSAHIRKQSHSPAQLSQSRSRIDKSGIEIESRQSRIRKSFSMNDMKSFLIHEAKIERNLERTTVLDSRSPVPVIVSNQDSSLLKPMRSQQLLK